MIPVKTSSAVPKERIFDVMEEINKIRLDSRVSIGDVLFFDVLGLGVDILATGGNSL